MVMYPFDALPFRSVFPVWMALLDLWAIVFLFPSTAELLFLKHGRHAYRGRAHTCAAPPRQHHMH